MVEHRNRSSWHDTNPHAGSDNDETWTARAACRTYESPNVFTDEPSKLIDRDGKKVAAGELAKAVCARCVVINQCLSHALENGEDNGIWGGLTTAERRKLRG